jgi:hypothetical protein
MIPSVDHNPAAPTIIGSRRYIITPRIVNIEGVKTPPKVPNLLIFAIRLGLSHERGVQLNTSCLDGGKM